MIFTLQSPSKVTLKFISSVLLIDIGNSAKSCTSAWYSNKTFNLDETPLSKEENDTIFIVRELEVVRFEDDEAIETRQFKHFHYVAWPDFGVPATPDDFGQFYDELEEFQCFSNPSSPR